MWDKYYCVIFQAWYRTFPCKALLVPQSVHTRTVTDILISYNIYIKGGCSGVAVLLIEADAYKYKYVICTINHHFCCRLIFTSSDVM